MSGAAQIPLLWVAGEPVSLAEALLDLRLVLGSGALAREPRWDWAAPLVDVILVWRAAARDGLRATATELWAAGESFRAAQGLASPAATAAWFRAQRLGAAEFERLLAFRCVSEKLLARYVRPLVAVAFERERGDLDAAELSEIVVTDEGLARELLERARAEGDAFPRLARQLSADLSALAGGYLGRVRRRELPAGIASAVFNAREGEVLGPFPISIGWQLLRVEELHPAVLDRDIRQELEDRLWREWLAAERAATEVRLGDVLVESPPPAAHPE